MSDLTVPQSATSREETGQFDAASFFNDDPVSFAYFRPDYPDKIYDAIVEKAELTPEARVLEVGAGTGIATLPLAQRGYDITALEPGENLARVGREHLKDYPNVTWVVEGLESVDLPPESFDLVFAAMSLHWVNEEARFKKPYRLLKDGGKLAILFNNPIRNDDTTRFYNEIDVITRQHGMKEGYPVPTRGELRTMPPIDEEYFEPFPNIWMVPRMYTDRTSGKQNYLGYLSTLSLTRNLSDEAKAAFLGDVSKVVEQTFGDVLELPFATTLSLATKK